MPTIQEILDANRELLSPVPTLVPQLTCHECLGPVDGYQRCYSCHQLFSAAPAALSGRTVPMSVVANPSPWYSRLKGYKGGMPREYRPVIASVAYTYLAEHASDFADLLGGAADIIAITPSKGRHAGGPHPLRDTLALVKPELLPVVEPLKYVGDGSGARGEYRPTDFLGEATQVDGARVILLEDIWVSGRTSVSAAGALLEAGAEAVVITPIARLVYVDPPVMVGADHPFFQWIGAPYDFAHWPR